jgi:hypothetical protein
MRGIDRVLAGLLLAGAIGGAAVFARSSGGLPTAALHLEQPPRQSLTAPQPVVIPLLPAADHVQQVIHLASTRPVTTTLLPPGLYVKTAEISLPQVTPRKRPRHTLPARPTGPSGGGPQPIIPAEPAPAAPATPAPVTPAPAPAPVETPPAPEPPRIPASTTPAPVPVPVPTPTQPTPVPTPAPPIPVVAAPTPGEPASSGNVHGLVPPPHDPTPVSPPPTAAPTQTTPSTSSTPPLAVKPVP